MYRSRAPARSGIAESFEVRDGFRRRTPARGRDRPQNCGKVKYAHIRTLGLPFRGSSWFSFSSRAYVRACVSIRASTCDSF